MNYGLGHFDTAKVVGQFDTSDTTHRIEWLDFGNRLRIDIGNATAHAPDPNNDYIEGVSDQPDLMVGDAGVNKLKGLSGDDAIFGRDGDDVLQGNNGGDVLHGGDGDDTLRGNGDADLLAGGAGADDIKGGSGEDLVEGGEGDDTLEGNALDDRLIGGAGADRHVYGTRNANDEIVAHHDDVIDDQGAATPDAEDTLAFSDVTDAEDSTLRALLGGRDLLVEHEAGSLTIENFYAEDGSGRIETIELGGAETFSLANAAEALISNIAMFGGEEGSNLDELTSYADNHGIQAPPPLAPSV